MLRGEVLIWDYGISTAFLIRAGLLERRISALKIALGLIDKEMAQ